MTQENKELLLKDLSARLPYGVICLLYANGTSITEELKIGGLEQFMSSSLGVKPYLRPMSSMTEEEIKELLNIDTKRGIFSSRHLTWHLDGEVVDYLNSHHFDYRGLIEKGLALKAPEGMY